MQRARSDYFTNSLPGVDEPALESDLGFASLLPELHADRYDDVQQQQEQQQAVARAPSIVSNDSRSLFDDVRDVDSSSDRLSDCSSVGFENVEQFEAKLRTLFTENNINHQQAGTILRLLKSHACFTGLHVDPRTILRTPAHSASIKKVAGGEYLHLGVQEAICSILSSTPLRLHPAGALEIEFSTDEASLDKNGKILMWPIQIRVANISGSAPQTIGIFKGSSKPTSALIFFQYFVDEVDSIIRNGLNFLNGIKQVVLRCFIADALARAFTLGHRSHNSRAPCSRCWVRGEHVRAGVMVYRGTDHRLRTDEEYRSKLDLDHHKDEDCALANLPFDLVGSTVFDYMHQVCIGVMEKILQGLIDGRFVASAKIADKCSLQILDNRLEHVKNFCPSDFARKPVNILRHGQFKATEYRQILLYSGPVIFRGLMNPAMYKHFILLSTAIRILANPVVSMESIDFAEKCIKLFVETASDVYGIEFLSYNVHTLLHLPDDVKRYGPLDNFSAFPYENNMSFCRKLCRKNDQHLQQISRRLAENCRTSSKKFVDPGHLSYISNHLRGPLIPGCGECMQYKKVVKGSTHLSIIKKDSTVMLDDGSIGIIRNVIELKDQGCHLVINLFSNIEDIFDLPCSSSLVGIVRCSNLNRQITIVKLERVVDKCFRMPYWSADDRISSTYCTVVKILSARL
ncbi:uncharacterized protein LOC103317700 isoform X1 [Nasonia vitripennis]|uniref:Transposase domain-containing protein n=1 Tax=Nasonia vitripennis TaxID=7425 RepID=A0A7M7R3Q3_NASVI|nr:uncharacterized protein LOC103317700 isoform X1 [Nasonia vitripennis]